MIKPIAVSLAMILGTNAQAMSKEQPAVDTLPLSECFIENVKTKALCGTLDVPENRQLPLSENNKIELNLVVLPKFKEESKKLPVMFLAGGPGQAATELAGMLNGPLHSVRQESDIILVDQRGTGKSSALKCDKELIDSLSYDDSKLDFQQETNDCLNQLSDKHLPSYNTYDSIEDFEAVREALGHRQVHIIGGSYGTRAGFAYLKQHPESIKTAILDSNAPMELVIGMFGKTSERAFDLLIEDCQAHRACAEAFPELKQDLLALMTRLKQQSIKSSVFHPVSGAQSTMLLSYEKVSETLRSMLYDLTSRQFLPYMIHSAANGDYRSLAAFIGRNVDSERMAGGLYTGLTMNILCNEDIPRGKPEAFANDADNYFNGEQGHNVFTQVCKYWPRWQAPENFAEPVTTDVPVLLFSGKYDPVTPPAYGEMALKNLPNAKHVVIEQGSHVASLRKCSAAIKSFIDQGNFDEIDFSCAETKTPFMFFTDLNQLH